MNIEVDESTVEGSESSYDDTNTTQLPVASTAKSLSQGRWHSADEIYKLLVDAKEVVEDVPPGDKSNFYLLVNFERNMKRLATGTAKNVTSLTIVEPGTTKREILLKRRML